MSAKNGAARNNAFHVARAGLLELIADSVEANSRTPANFQRACAESTAAALTLAEIDRLTSGRLGTHDIPCPLCGPLKSPHGQRRKVLRVWRVERGFATYLCQRCGESGYVRDRHSPEPDPIRLAQAKAEAAERDRIHKAERLAKARWLWGQRAPIAETIAEKYLREARGYCGPLPKTVAFLPGDSRYPPALIAAFGFAHEAEPGVIHIADEAICGVHLTRLLPDGSDRERNEGAKITIGRCPGIPIVLASPNDLLGAGITEGIEDALSVHEATGLGAWAAGSAARMPALADAVPQCIEVVTIYSHSDSTGQRGAHALAEALHHRGIEVLLEGVRP